MSLRYYRTNALYDYIVQNGATQFVFVSGDAWQLVYGNKACEPKLLVMAFGVDARDYNLSIFSKYQRAIDVYSHVAQISKLSLIFIIFRIDIAALDEVLLSDNPFHVRSVALSQLPEAFRSQGLPCSTGSTRKYLNDATSSAYHKWQRANLGAGITVSDMDLWRVDDSNRPLIAFELKRSIIPLNRWEPYTDDYNNFRLISNLCRRASVQFKIAYNVRHKNPLKDDISQLKLFAVNFAVNPSIALEGVLDINQFLKL